MKLKFDKDENAIPLISVITVALNAVEFIEQCIRSVVKQDFNNFEYIIIDGGSIDGTKEVIEKYSDKITYWHSKKDRGLAHAFNEGVQNSKGKWLIFLNSDDTFVNNEVLSNISNILIENEEADVVFGQVDVVSREQVPTKLGGPYGNIFKWKEFLKRDTIPHQAAFTNIELFGKNGYFDEAFLIAVDYEHYLRMGSKLKAKFYPLLVANMRDGGLSQVSKIKTLQDIHRARVVNKATSYLYSYVILNYFILRVLIREFINKFKVSKCID